MPKDSYDFSGYATRVDIRCADGRTIKKGAFKDCDGKVVPLVYNHDHSDIGNVLGHALLEYRDSGDIYAYCSCNDTEKGRSAKEQVRHGDLTSFSIYANHIRQNGGDVVHGNIRELSLVLAGANPGAYIDTVLMHSDDDEEDAVIHGFESDLEIMHAEEEPEKEEPKMAENKEKTVEEVLDELTDEQRQVVEGLIAMAMENNGGKNEDEGDDEDMKHNAFENDYYDEDVMHSDGEVYISSDEVKSIMADAKKFGSLKDAVIAHGIDHIDYLFPDYKNLDTPPQYIKRDTNWVSKVMNGVKKTPFSRIRSTFADITADEARARGYIKGHQKVSEVISILKRTTDPTTVYKLQKFDRDDMIDITDFDVVTWIKSEMRMMLDEEIARAVLVGDGREAGTEYSISKDHIRPIWTDSNVFTTAVDISMASTATAADKANATIEAIIRNRKFYKGTGKPTFYTTEDVLTEMLLLKDLNGRVIYEDETKLATALRVSEIVTIPVMENLTREVEGDTKYLQGIIVNLADYSIGADKGGAVNMFDDFDIDYNKFSYLVETRCSGALTTPKSAIVVELSFQ